MTLPALPYILLLGFLYGSSLVASRFCVGQFHPTTYLGLRLVVASLSYTFVYLLGNRHQGWPSSARLWRHAAVLGVIGTAVPSAAFVNALPYLSAGVMSLLAALGPVFTVLMAHFFLADEGLTRRKTAGVIVALAGAVLLAARGESGLPEAGPANPLGYGLTLLGLVSSGGMTIYARKYMQELDAFEVASVRTFTATLVVLPLSVLLVGVDLQDVTRQGYLSLVYAGLAGSFLGLLLGFYIIKRFGATASAMPLYLVPVVGGLGGVLLLGEQFTPGMTAGFALIAVGIALINQRVDSIPV